MRAPPPNEPRGRFLGVLSLGLQSVSKTALVTKSPMSRLSFIKNSSAVSGSVVSVLVLVFAVYQLSSYLWSWASNPSPSTLWQTLDPSEFPLLVIAAGCATALTVASRWLRKRAKEPWWCACLTSSEELFDRMTYLAVGAWFYSLCQTGKWSTLWFIWWVLGMFVGRWRQAARELAHSRN